MPGGRSFGNDNAHKYNDSEENDVANFATSFSRTCEELAQEHHVSPKTVTNAAGLQSYNFCNSVESYEIPPKKI
jgi:hypothetical protein